VFGTKLCGARWSAGCDRPDVGAILDYGGRTEVTRKEGGGGKEKKKAGTVPVCLGELTRATCECSCTQVKMTEKKEKEKKGKTANPEPGLARPLPSPATVKTKGGKERKRT